jgi:hypothetical protein
VPVELIAAELNTGGTPTGVTEDEAPDEDTDVLSPLIDLDVNV